MKREEEDGLWEDLKSLQRLRDPLNSRCVIAVRCWRTAFKVSRRKIPSRNKEVSLNSSRVNFVTKMSRKFITQVCYLLLYNLITLTLPLTHKPSPKSLQNIPHNSVLRQIQSLDVIPGQNIHATHLPGEDGVVEGDKDSVFPSCVSPSVRRDKKETHMRSRPKNL